MTGLRSYTIGGLLLCLLVASPGAAQIPPSAQPAAGAGETTTQGVVVSSARSTLVVRAADGHYELFVLDANTTRPEQIPAQSAVTVVSRKGAGDQAANALLVRITAPPPAVPPQVPAEGAAPATRAVTTTTDEPVPQSVRQLEDSIKRQTRRFHIGVRGGLALDPELVMVGTQMQLGPFFKSSFIVRPTLDLGFGEVTTLVAVNLDGLYQLPSTTTSSTWKMYVGGGPGFNFSKLSFTDENGDEEDFSFSDLVFDGGFNVIIGLQSRSGMFVELRSTAYSTPHMQFILGYNF